MKSNLFSKVMRSRTAKTVIIVIEIASLLTLAIVAYGIYDGGFISSKDEGTTMYTFPEQSTTKTSSDSHYGYDNYNGGGSVSQNTDNTHITDKNNLVNGVQGNSQQPKPLENVSGWTTAQILSKASDAVNKTKAYQKSVIVNHKESFVADVTECTGGTIVQSVANMMIGWVVEPVDETLTFNGGRAVNSEGENVSLILPQKNGFNLTEQGVNSATIKTVGNTYVIKIKIVEERVGMHDVPRHNAAAVGYLDVANFDLSFLTVESANIRYKGSTVELHINSDGYVTYAQYHIPLNVKGSGNGAGISGSVTFDGEQTEIWSLNY